MHATMNGVKRMHYSLVMYVRGPANRYEPKLFNFHGR